MPPPTRPRGRRRRRRRAAHVCAGVLVALAALAGGAHGDAAECASRLLRAPAANGGDGCGPCLAGYAAGRVGARCWHNAIHRGAFNFDGALALEMQGGDSRWPGERTINVADINNDGLLDIIFVDHGAPPIGTSVEAWLATEPGQLAWNKTFIPQVALELLDPRAVGLVPINWLGDCVVTDVDKDGLADLIISGFNQIHRDSFIAVLYGTGNLGFSAPDFEFFRSIADLPAHNILYHPSSTWLADLDGDGVDEAITLSAVGEIRFFKSDADERSWRLIDSWFVRDVEDVYAAVLGKELQIYDVDGDGDLDLVVLGNALAGPAAFYRNDGNSSHFDFVLVTGVDPANPLDTSNFLNTVIADVDNQGEVEAIRYALGSPVLEVARREFAVQDNRFTSLGAEFGLSFSRFTIDFAVLDYNQDGLPDLVILTLVSMSECTFTFYRGVQHGLSFREHFELSHSQTIDFFISAFNVMDADGDGAPDYIVAWTDGEAYHLRAVEFDLDPSGYFTQRSEAAHNILGDRGLMSHVKDDNNHDLFCYVYRPVGAKGEVLPPPDARCFDYTAGRYVTEGRFAMSQDVERENTIIFADVTYDGHVDRLILKRSAEAVSVLLYEFDPTTGLFLPEPVPFLRLSDFNVGIGLRAFMQDGDGDGDIDIFILDELSETLHSNKVLTTLRNTAVECASDCSGQRGLCGNAANVADFTFSLIAESQGLPQRSDAVGACLCNPYTTGLSCEQCKPEYFGVKCDQTCPPFSSTRLQPGDYPFPHGPTLNDCRCKNGFVQQPGEIHPFRCMCQPGYGFANATASCEPCQPGYFKPSIGNKLCQRCPAGFATTTPGQSVCKPVTCPAGQEPLGIGDTCVLCSIGYYRPQASSNLFCTKCSEGYTTMGAGQSSCIRQFCPPGTFRDVAGECNLCPRDSYQPFNAQSPTCTDCPANFPRTINPGANSSSQCVLGENAFLDSTGHVYSCTDELVFGKVDCQGAAGLTVASLPILPGFWRVSTGTLDIRECPEPERCIPQRLTINAFGVNDFQPAGDQLCTSHHRGILCSTCEEGFGMSGKRCIRCTSDVVEVHTNRLVALSLIGALAVLIPPLYVLYRSRVTPRSNSCWHMYQFRANRANAIATAQVQFRTFLGFVQVLVEFTRTLGTMSSRSTAILAVFANIDLSAVFGIVDVGCAVSINHFGRLVIYTIMPLWCILATALVLVVQSRCAAEMFASAVQLAAWLVFQLLFVLYPGISAAIVRTIIPDSFPAFPGDPKPYRTLLTDYTINFDSPESWDWRWFAAVMFCVYPIGIVVLFALGNIFSKRLLEQNADKAEWKIAIAKGVIFLSDPYTEEASWFESYELLRKFMLTSILVLVESLNVGTGMIYFPMIVFLSNVVLARLTPYKSDDTQAFAAISLALLFFMWAAVFAASTSEDRKDIRLSAAVFCSAGLEAIVFIYYVSLAFRMPESRLPSASVSQRSARAASTASASVSQRSARAASTASASVSQRSARAASTDSAIALRAARAASISSHRPPRVIIASDPIDQDSPDNAPEPTSSSPSLALA